MSADAKAPRLTMPATVMEAREGVVEIDADNEDEFITFQVEGQDLAKWRSLLRKEHAVRITVEPICVPDAQPRDLAGRIRALGQEYDNRWADACDEKATSATRDAHDREYALRVVIDDLRDAYLEVKKGRPLQDWIRWMRVEGQPHGNEALMAARLRLADELDTIVRECAGEQR